MINIISLNCSTLYCFSFLLYNTVFYTWQVRNGLMLFLAHVPVWALLYNIHFLTIVLYIN